MVDADPPLAIAAALSLGSCVNQLLMTAHLSERSVLRYTPAGIPAIDTVLRHEGPVDEAGVRREVMVEIRAVALGDLATQLNVVSLGRKGLFGGFLGASRNRKGVVFHITQFNAESFIDSESK